MQISGKVRIANKWVNGVVDKNSFDFEHLGNYAKGRLSWSDVKKGKDGEKPTFITTTKKFVTFKDSMQIIGNNLGKFFNVTGQLKSEEFMSEGKLIKFDQIVLNTVELFDESKSDKPKKNVVKDYDPDEIMDGEIDF